jgi:hypothetical protein
LQRTSLFIILPDQKLGVVVLANSLEAEESATPIAAQVLELGLEVKAGIKKPVEAPPVASLLRDELSRYEGLNTTDFGPVNVRLQEMELYADVVGQSFRLVPHGKDGIPLRVRATWQSRSKKRTNARPWQRVAAEPFPAWVSALSLRPCHKLG